MDSQESGNGTDKAKDEKEGSKSPNSLPADKQLTANSFQDCWTIKVLVYRFHFLPPLISVTFIIMMVLCYIHAPGQYREIKVFQISNLGNWGPGISFFSSSMVVIAWFIYNLSAEMIRQRILVQYRRKILTSYGPLVYKLGSIILFFGLIIAGCFQQNYNKPAHNIGVLAMTVGFGFILYYDMLYLKYNKSRTTIHKASAAAQVLLVILITVCAVGFVILLGLAKLAWMRGEEEALASRNLTECPVWGVDEALNGSVYPYFYPCKSPTLRLPGDPGWTEFKYSSYLEIVMFLGVAVYPLTYLTQLEIEDKLPAWLIPVLELHIPLRSFDRKLTRVEEI